MIKGEKLARPIVKSVLRRLFGNQAWPLISHLLQVGNLLLEDLQYLESQISPQLEKQEQKGKSREKATGK